MKWTRIESEVVYRSRRVNLRRDVSRADSTGRVHEFHVVELADWVTVVPITHDRQVVMVRQFRHGIGDLTLEFPAGILDPEDPSPSDAALRELREETGYAAGRIEALGRLHPNPALQANHCHMFAAYDVTPDGPTHWDPTEEIVIECLPLSDIPDLIRRGEVTNALTIAAFHLLSLR